MLIRAVLWGQNWTLILHAEHSLTAQEKVSGAKPRKDKLLSF